MSPSYKKYAIQISLKLQALTVPTRIIHLDHALTIDLAQSVPLLPQTRIQVATSRIKFLKQEPARRYTSLAKQKIKRLTAVVEGIEKVLIRIFLQKDGSITLMPVSLAFLTENVHVTGDTEPTLIQTKYSLHMSAKSQTHNTIKHTTSSDQGEITRVHQTRAIKSTGKFAYIGSRRFSNLLGEKFNCKADSQNNIQLCQFDPKKWTLFVHLAWSRRDRKCNLIAFRDWRHTILKFETTELHIFFRFSACVAMPSARDFSHLTIDPKLIEGRIVQSEFGYEDIELVTMLKAADNFLDEDVFQRLISLLDVRSPELQKALRKVHFIGRSRNMSINDIVANAEGAEKLKEILDKIKNI